MSASAEMPYFIKPSVNLKKSAKKAAYKEAIKNIDAVLDAEKEDNRILKMVTINCLLKTHLPYYYWVGFYLVNKGKLSVGPYQGTMGCLHIDFSQGVCGKTARTKKTQIVKDCHKLVQGKQHIACDPNSKSEIVLPVFSKKGKLIAVFDVDSSKKKSFDKTDKKYLEQILTKHFAN